MPQHVAHVGRQAAQARQALLHSMRPLQRIRRRHRPVWRCTHQAGGGIREDGAGDHHRPRV
jgi:hypothetical protein